MESSGQPGGNGTWGSERTVIGHDQPLPELATDLIHALADDPRIVVCDVSAMEVSASDLVEAFTPAADYLADWPGTGMVVVCPHDEELREGLRAVPLRERLVVSATREAGVAELHRVLPPLVRTEVHLDARLTAPRAARLFTARSLLEWRLMPLIASASLVVSELVTNSVVHAASTVDLAVSRSEGRLQITVRDHHGVGQPQPQRSDPHDHYLGGRGLLLVQEMTRSWGVFPAEPEGKMVWAVLDAA